MSVNPSAGMDMTYSDHDVHHVLHELRFQDTADSGPNDMLRDTRQFDITERGLDPDELAELRGMSVTAVAIFRAAAATDSVGSFSARVGAGYNLTGDEFLQAEPNVTSIDNDNSGTDDYQIRTRDTDEVGQLYSTSLSGSTPYDDDANGNGGGGVLPLSTTTIDFTELTGTGPVVDSADDFSSSIDLEVLNVITDVGFRMLYSLYYAVEEQEGGRTRFGR